MWRPSPVHKHSLPLLGELGREQAALLRWFQPIRVGSATLCARTWVPAMVPWRASDDGLVSERVLEDNWNVAVGASAIGTLNCVDCWTEDFRKDIAKNKVPTLILHGDADRILPPDATSRRQVKLIKNARLVELPGGPHGVLWTHADQINRELVKFLA